MLAETRIRGRDGRRGASRTPNSAFALFGAYEPGCAYARDRALQGRFPPPPPITRFKTSQDVLKPA